MRKKEIFLHIPLIEGEALAIKQKPECFYVVSNLERVWRQTSSHPHTDVVELSQDEIKEFNKDPYDDGYPKHNPTDY